MIFRSFVQVGYPWVWISTSIVSWKFLLSPCFACVPEKWNFRKWTQVSGSELIRSVAPQLLIRPNYFVGSNLRLIRYYLKFCNFHWQIEMTVNPNPVTPFLPPRFSKLKIFCFGRFFRDVKFFKIFQDLSHLSGLKFANWGPALRGFGRIVH